LRRSERRTRPLQAERLEDRRLLSISLFGVPAWQEQGPGGEFNGQTEGITNDPRGVNPVAGAVQSVAAHPKIADILYVTAVNGGVWRTDNALDPAPNWVPLTDQYPSLSMGDIQFSLLDPSFNTLFASHARFSSGASDGGPLNGILRTTDGGSMWTQLGQTTFANLNIHRVLPTLRGSSLADQVVFAAANNGAGGGGLYRSPDGGDTWVRISGLAGTGLPAGDATDVDGDPSNTKRFYVGILGQGVFRSDNEGLTWTPVNTGLSLEADGVDNNRDGTIDEAAEALNQSNFIELAVHGSDKGNAVYAAIFGTVRTGGTRLNGVFRSTNLGAMWTAMDLPGQTEPVPATGGTTFFNLGFEGFVAHPSDPNLIFMVGGAQPGPFPTSQGCSGFTARVMRGNAALPPGGQWEPFVCNPPGALPGANGTSPHADARDLEFDRQGNLLHTHDGGISRLANTNDPTRRRWESVNGNLRTNEFYSLAYDSVSDTLFGGTQDVGTPTQRAFDSLLWNDATQADGGMVAADNTSAPGFSSHYVGTQFLGGFSRRDGRDNDGDGTIDECDEACVQLRVAGAGSPANNIFGVEESLNPGPNNGTIQFIQPYVLNAVDPRRMLIGTNFLYESTNSGDTLTALGGLANLNGDGIDNDIDTSITVTGFVVGTDEGDEFAPMNPVGTVTAMAYGGRSGGVANAAVIWAGAGGQLLHRASGTGLPTAITTYPGRGARDIVLNPDDWREAYVLDFAGDVYRTTDAGATVAAWTRLTGNLGSFTSNLRTIELHQGATLVLLVGGYGGVYRLINPGSGSVWSELGERMPNVVVTDVHYDTTDQLLYVGTFGRSSWKIGKADTVLTTPSLLSITGDTDAADQDDVIRLVRQARNPLMLDIFLNNSTSTPNRSVELAALEKIAVNGLGGNDTLIVDQSNGPVQVPLGISYEGGAGTDDLQVAGSPDTTRVDASTVRVGLMGAVPDVTYAGDVEQLTVGADDRTNNLFIDATRTPVTVNAGAGENTIHLSAVRRDLADVAGALTINGGPRGAALVVNDQNSTVDSAFTITDTFFDNTCGPACLPVGSPFTPLVTYTGLRSLALHTSNLNSTIDVNATSTGAEVSVNGGSGDDTFRVGAGRLDNIRGPLTINGGPAGGPPFGTNTLHLDDGSNLAPDSFRLTAASIGRTASAGSTTVNYANVNSLILAAGGGDNTFQVDGTPLGMPATIRAGDGNDLFRVNTALVRSTLTLEGGAPVGAPGDAMEINGTPSTSIASCTATRGDGSCTVDGQTINFTSLEPIVVSGLASFAFTTSGSADVIMVSSPTPGRGRIAGTSDGLAFESFDFFDVATVFIDTATNDSSSLENPDTADDLVTFASGMFASRLGQITIVTGDGDDAVDATGILVGLSVETGKGADRVTGGNGSDQIDDASGQDVLNGGPGCDLVNGVADPPAIQGQKFDDRDGDGAKDAGEPGLDGWQIFLDLNHNGQLDADPQDNPEPVVATRSFDRNGDSQVDPDTEQGFYCFAELPPGAYDVREILVADWVQTLPGSPSAPDGYMVTYDGSTTQTRDFGNFRLVALSGRKFEDLDADGKRGPDEPDLAKWVIELDLDNDGATDSTAITDLDGRYVFNAVPPGTHKVRELVEPGYIQSLPAVPGDYTIAVTSGIDLDVLDFANYRPVAISGQKFEDVNGDGQHQSTEPGINGWTIFLDSNGNGQLDGGGPNAEPTATTGDLDRNSDGNIDPFTETGWYSFTGLAPGAFEVREAPVASGWVQSLPVDATTGAAAPYVVVLASGEAADRRDFGNYRPASIHGQKFEDKNGDGARQEDEPGLNDWTIFLDVNRNEQLDTDAAGEPIEPTATTQDMDIDNDGQINVATERGLYWFSDVRPGSYEIREVRQPNWRQMLPEPRLRCKDFEDFAPGCREVPGIHQVTLVSGSIVEQRDFANFEEVVLSGQKFDDVNGNGVKDASEGGLADWTVELDLNNDGTVDQTGLTGPDGSYRFVNVGPGTHRVGEVSQPGFSQTFPQSGSYTITISSGVDSSGLDFGNDGRGPQVRQVQLIQDARRRIKGLQFTFSERLDPVGAVNPQTYRVLSVARNQQCGGGDAVNKPVLFGAPTYDGKLIVGLSFDRPLRATVGLDVALLAAQPGTDSPGISDRLGNALDGDADGQTGPDFTACFEPTRSRGAAHRSTRALAVVTPSAEREIERLVEWRKRDHSVAVDAALAQLLDSLA
jgi:hypothetical protein